MHKVIGLKIDVDTFIGMKYGVPKIASLLSTFGIKASFYVPMGRDNTGRTVKRIFRKGFLKKARRIGVVKTYGAKTLLYGLLIPGPRIPNRNKSILKQILNEGHELGIHGYDHIFWHDRIKTLGFENTKRELEKAINTYKALLNVEPKSFAAPGWVTNVHALKLLKSYGFLYSSDTRGRFPFYPMMGGEVVRLMQIPTTLPTLDEVIGIHGNEPETLVKYYESLLTDSINILTVHAEIEGKNWIEFLKIYIERTFKLGYTYKTLANIANTLKQEELPLFEVVYGYVEGRAGYVCISLDT
ncbi:MAG: polysaccharide deacetylase family protein [Deltaproteobacteria bacterium]|nr:polysaccharide deacetylase family protein [Deltaproteobacteria bacterium]